MGSHADQLKDLQEDAYVRVLRVIRKLRTGQTAPDRERLLFTLKRELNISEQFHISSLQKIADEPDIDRGKKASTSKAKGEAGKAGKASSKPGAGGGSGPKGKAGGAAERAAASGPSAPPGAVAAMDPAMKEKLEAMRKHIGKGLNVWWENGYYRGLITDVNVLDDTFCVAYDLGTDYESFEWLPAEEILNGEPAYVILPDAPIDVTQLPPPGSRARGLAGGGPQATPAPASGGAKKGGNKRAGGATGGAKKKKKKDSSDDDLSFFEDPDDEDFFHEFGDD